MKTIDLSCDLGEAAGAAQQRVEDAIWPLITSANVACGSHAGDERTMRYAVMQAFRYGVRLGAHPSYPDREHFGRRSMKLPVAELRHSLVEQITALVTIADGTLTHVKPHGALYNDAHHDPGLARTVAEAIASVGRSLAMVASADSALFQAAREAGLPTIAEAFADRRYRKDGSLVPRSHQDALLMHLDDAADQALSLATSGLVRTLDGIDIRVRCDTLCIHGDMEKAGDRLARIRDRLAAAGYTFASTANSA